MKEYTHHFIPADGWYMTHPVEGNSKLPRVFYRVALWRVDSDGNVDGLISPNLRGCDRSTTPPVLIGPPRGEGAQYVHIDDLAEDDRELITRTLFS